MRTRLATTVRTVTSLGWGAAGTSAVLFTAAAILGYPEVVVLAVGPLVALVAAVVLTAWPPRIAAEVEVHPMRVARGEAAVATITVRNMSSRPSFAFTLYLPYGDETLALRVRPLRGGTRRAVVRPVPTGLRGLYEVGPIRLRRSDPFGLLCRDQVVGAAAALAVGPRVYPLRPLAAARVRNLAGRDAATAPTGGIAFHSLRAYVPGDDLRYVHWRSSVRVGMLMVRQQVDSGEPVSSVVLDTRRAAYPPGVGGADNFEAAVDITASVVSTLLRQGFAADLRILAGPRLTTRGGRGEGTELLDALTVVQPVQAVLHEPPGRGDPLAALARAPAGPAGGMLTVVTGTEDLGQLAAAALAVGRFDAVVVIRVGRLSPDTPDAQVAAGGAGGTGGTGTMRQLSRGLRSVEVPDALSLAATWAALEGWKGPKASTPTHTPAGPSPRSVPGRVTR